jgi:hypothetical protein
MLVVELVELKLVLFPHCLAERQFDRTLNQPNKVWHDRRPFTVFLIALTTTFVILALAISKSRLGLCQGARVSRWSHHRQRRTCLPRRCASSTLAALFPLPNPISIFAATWASSVCPCLETRAYRRSLLPPCYHHCRGHPHGVIIIRRVVGGRLFPPAVIDPPFAIDSRHGQS